MVGEGGNKNLMGGESTEGGIFLGGVGWGERMRKFSAVGGGGLPPPSQ